MTEKPKRLMSLDALRGFDMLWIIGGERVIHLLAAKSDSGMMHSLSDQFRHVPWDGFRFYDLIFPLFIFMAGMSMPFAITSKLEKGIERKTIVPRLIKRLLLLLLFGAVYNGMLNFSDGQRYASVLARIGISTFLAALVVLYCDKYRQLAVFFGLLAGYWIGLKTFAAPGFAAGDLSMAGNFTSWVDCHLLPGRLHRGIHDPEGLLSNIPAAATALAGVMSGHLIRSPGKEISKFKIMFAGGVALLVLGWLWHLVLPVNKNIWSSSFVLVTAGWSCISFSVFYLVIDIKGFQKWATPMQWIGVNSILIYMLASGKIIDFNGVSTYFFKGASEWLTTTYFEVIVAVMAIFIELALLKYLYRKKTFLKV